MNHRPTQRATSKYPRPLLAGGFAMILLGLGLVAAGSAGAAGPSGVDLRTAGAFAVLGGQTVTNTGPTVINGDLGLSPGSSVTGFPPGTVNGTIHEANGVAAQAKSDLVTAYDDAAGRTSTGAITAGLGGQTLTPGVYTSASSMGLDGTLTLDGGGDPDAVFIFQAGSTLTAASASGVNLIGRAQACNVVWQVGSSATLGTDSNFVGNVLAFTSITMDTRSTILGSTLARNGAVTLDTNTVSRAICAAAEVTTTTTSGGVTTTSGPGSTTTVPGGGTTATTVPGGGTTATTVPGGGTTGTTRPGTRTDTGITTGTINRPPLANTGAGRDGMFLGVALMALGLALMLVTRRRPAALGAGQ
jgi:hypothetical protein